MIPRKLNHGDGHKALFVLWNQLIDYLHRAKLVAGPGIRITRSASGTVVTASSNRSGAAVIEDPSPAGGSFLVTLFTEEGKDEPSALNVTAGYVNVNGTFITVKGEKIDLDTGILCVCVEIDKEKPGFKDPEIKFAEPTEFNHPIAVISQEKNNYVIKQYPIAVATFLITKTCIYAKAAGKK